MGADQPDLQGYVGSTQVTKNRRCRLPKRLFNDGGLRESSDLFWTYDTNDLVPVFTTEHPHLLNDSPNTELIEQNKPYRSSERTVKIPARYFPDWSGNHRDAVPDQAQVDTGDKLYILGDADGGTLVCHLFKIDKLARLDLEQVVQTPPQRARLVSDLEFADWQAARSSVEKLLQKITDLELG